MLPKKTVTTYFDKEFVRRAYEGVQEMYVDQSMLSDSVKDPKYLDVNRYCRIAIDRFGNMIIKYTDFDRDFFLKLDESDNELKLNGNSDENQWQKCRIVTYRHIFTDHQRYALAVAFYNGKNVGLVYEALNLFRGLPNITKHVSFDYNGIGNGKAKNPVESPRIGLTSFDSELLVLIGDQTDEGFLEEGGVGRVSHNILPSLHDFVMPIVTGDFLFYDGEKEFYTTNSR